MDKIYLKLSFIVINLLLFTSSTAFSSESFNNKENHEWDKSFKVNFATEEKNNNDTEIRSFTLVNAVTSQDLFEITEGQKINLREIGTQYINIRANTGPQKTESVLFQLSGKQDREHIENISPYALFANDKNNYYKWNPAPGNYIIKATPYTEDDAKGKKGTSLSISFEIIDDIQVVSFVLVNADNNKDILEIKEGMEIDLQKLPSQNINFRANTIPKEVGSVEISVTDLVNDNFYSHIENAVPYALFSDHKGNYNGRRAENGSFLLKAIPYELNMGRGRKGYSLILSFKMKNGEDFSVAKFTQSNVVLESFRVFPNPGKNALNIFLENPQANSVKVQIYDVMGNEVLVKDKKITSAPINIMLDVSELESKPYILKLSSDKNVKTIRWFKE